MSDSRSYGAEMEDTNKVCKYGFTSRYYDNCNCEGCNTDRKTWSDIIRYSDAMKYDIMDILDKVERKDWPLIKSIKVNFK